MSYTHFGISVTPVWSTKRHVAGGVVVDVHVHDVRSTVTSATVNVANLLESLTDCNCFGERREGIVHDGDCPTRCATMRGNPHDPDAAPEHQAQCDRMRGHDGVHHWNLHRGSPSARRERGQCWPVPVASDCEWSL